MHQVLTFEPCTPCWQCDQCRPHMSRPDRRTSPAVPHLSGNIPNSRSCYQHPRPSTMHLGLLGPYCGRRVRAISIRMLQWLSQAQKGRHRGCSMSASKPALKIHRKVFFRQGRRNTLTQTRTYTKPGVRSQGVRASQPLILQYARAIRGPCPRHGSTAQIHCERSIPTPEEHQMGALQAPVGMIGSHFGDRRASRSVKCSPRIYR